MVSTLQYEIFGVFIAAIGVVVALWAFNRYLRGRGPELALREGKSVLDDRAYNQVRIAEAAADRLARTGADVTAAKALLDRAEAARASGTYSVAIELAKKAQDLLAAARSGEPSLGASTTAGLTASPIAVTSPSFPSTGQAPASVSGPSGSLSSPTPVYLEPSNAAGMGLPGATGRPPKNQMEAHFQLSVAKDELAKARTSKPGPKSFREADRQFAAAQAAYDRQDFTEALRLALRSRRTLGARVEGLPVSTVPSAVSSAGGSPVTAVGTDSGSPAAGDPTFGQKCPKCGRVAAANDQFCRVCGSAIPPALCRNCGAPLLTGDRFCGKCGATQA